MLVLGKQGRGCGLKWARASLRSSCTVLSDEGEGLFFFMDVGCPSRRVRQCSKAHSFRDIRARRASSATADLG